MSRVSHKHCEESMASKQKRSRKPRNRHSRTTAPAEIRCNRVTRKSCTDIVREKILVFDSKKVKNGGKVVYEDHDPSMLSPERHGSCPAVGLLDEQQKLPETPKTPQSSDFHSESRLESLPMDLLVKIICHLHHDQLRAVFHVSHRISAAVTLARKCHFDYTTPDRARQEILRMKTPAPTEYWPFGSKVDGKGKYHSIPLTPRAPKHGPRPPPRLKRSDLQQVGAVLFQECARLRCMWRPGLLAITSSGSNRVLLYEEELSL